MGNFVVEFVVLDMQKNPQFKIVKAGEKAPVFVGSKEVAEHCFKVLHDSFFFVAGNAKPIVEKFPFSLVPA